MIHKNLKKNIVISIVALLFFINTSYALSALEGDFFYYFSGLFKPEMFYGKNVSLLNNNNDNDKLWFMRHTLDMKLGIQYGNKTYGNPVSELFFGVRNRGIWGNPNSIAATTEAETKILDSVGRRHRHAIPRHIFWMREIWLWFDLATLTGLPFIGNHSFTLGLFPFELGRGIALGDAYAIGPEILGYYTETAVDQYAPGAKISGTILRDKLYYDLYAAILQNRSSSLSETAEKILGQEFGRIDRPARGFGKINFLIAARFKWDVFNDECLGKFTLEPYGLFNHDPEQRVEFIGDATSKLGTVGLAGEYLGDLFEGGFDYAVNLGQQRVKGWDRNQIIEANRDGQVILVNSHVVDQNNKSIPFVPGGQAQNIIFMSFRDETQNGQIIGTIDSNIGFVPGPVTLRNRDNRFRNPFTNKYEGWMFVADAGYWVYKNDVLFAVTAGIATGDSNPNEETIDGVFSGFVGLQEIYSGDRVKSAFLLGGSGKLKRPLSAPQTNQVPSRFAVTVNGFTNLVFVGTGVRWKPQSWKREFSFHPNILTYWQEKPGNKFDFVTRTELNNPASTYLGTEVDLFVHYYIFKNMKLFFVGSIFFPGTHYRDTLGRPLTADQDRLLDQLDRTGFSADRIPNLGKDIAYTGNLGLEFRF